jgi:hypothetical protein
MLQVDHREQVSSVRVRGSQVNIRLSACKYLAGSGVLVERVRDEPGQGAKTGPVKFAVVPDQYLLAASTYWRPANSYRRPPLLTVRNPLFRSHWRQPIPTGRNARHLPPVFRRYAACQGPSFGVPCRGSSPTTLVRSPSKSGLWQALEKYLQPSNGQLLAPAIQKRYVTQ